MLMNCNSFGSVYITFTSFIKFAILLILHCLQYQVHNRANHLVVYFLIYLSILVVLNSENKSHVHVDVNWVKFLEFYNREGVKIRGLVLLQKLIRSWWIFNYFFSLLIYFRSYVGDNTSNPFSLALWFSR